MAALLVATQKAKETLITSTLHSYSPFSANENEDAVASSFSFCLFVAAAWVHQYLPQGDSIIGTRIIITAGHGYTNTCQGSSSIIGTL